METRRTMTSGIMKNIHSPKPMGYSESCISFRNFIAIALGGVPMGVPSPPMEAEKDIPRIYAVASLDFVGNCLTIGATIARKIHAVAVLFMNIEKSAVAAIKPSRTVSGFVPKGRNIALAICISKPHDVAAALKHIPPKNIIMTGSAKDVRMLR